MKDLIGKIGKTVMFMTDDMAFDVEIVNLRKAYGRIDYEVKPIKGAGTKWISSERVKEYQDEEVMSNG